MGLTMEDTSPGYAPHDVDITFDNRYGVCRDKAGLLVAMLRLAGFKAFPVLIHVGAKLDPEVPQPFFNHAIVAVEEEVGVGSPSRTKEAAKHHRKPEISKNSQNNIMQIYMMVMILFFGMTLPSAMSLYWAINSLVNIVKTLVVQTVIDKSDLKEGRAR